MSLHDILVADRRLSILELLEQMPGYKLNEDVLYQGVSMRGTQVSHDTIRTELAWLEEQGLVEVVKLPLGGTKELWLATLTNRGLDVVNGIEHPGVARPLP